jgi:hypothetical protein
MVDRSVTFGTPSKLRPESKVRACGWLALFLWLAVTTLTLSPALHELLHDDSRSAVHVCVVTDLEKQQLLYDANTVELPQASWFAFFVSGHAKSILVSQIERRFLPARAPPRLQYPIVAA